MLNSPAAITMTLVEQHGEHKQQHQQPQHQPQQQSQQQRKRATISSRPNNSQNHQAKSLQEHEQHQQQHFSAAGLLLLEKEEDEYRENQSSINNNLKNKNNNLDNNTATNTTTTTAAATATNSDHNNKHADFQPKVVWFNVLLFVILHSGLPIGFYMLFTQWPLRTTLWSVFLMYASGLGVTGGAHRLWSHKSYKARWPVEVLLVVLQTMAGQNSVYTWSRDHRVHHKYSETDADPHNIKRGFFFAHMGWLCYRKHPLVKEKGALIDMSDLKANPVVMFQHKHFWWMAITWTVLVPTLIPVYAWGEHFWTSFVLSFMIRYIFVLHGTWLVNSAAHYTGSRPYDQHIEARENPHVIYTALGEGFHNYHHTFPYDYATSEFGRYLNITTAFIDVCASLGLVSDRRKVSQEMIERRKARTGSASAGLEQQQQHEMEKHELATAE